MKITVLGTRGEIDLSAPYHSKQSGVLIDNKLLFDCGDQRFLSYKPTHIFLTHLHPDHAFFTRHHEQSSTNIPMYAPETYLDWPITTIKKTVKVGTYTITPIPTVHSIKAKSTAYLITHGKKRILYTGDMIWIEKKYHRLLHNLDLVITEASYIRKGGLVRRDKKTGTIYGHTGVPNLIHLFKPYTNTFLLVHFGSWFYKDMKKARSELQHLARMNEVTIIVGYDGLKITV